MSRSGAEVGHSSAAEGLGDRQENRPGHSPHEEQHPPRFDASAADEMYLIQRVLGSVAMVNEPGLRMLQALRSTVSSAGPSTTGKWSRNTFP